LGNTGLDQKTNIFSVSGTDLKKLVCCQMYPKTFCGITHVRTKSQTEMVLFYSKPMPYLLFTFAVIDIG